VRGAGGTVGAGTPFTHAIPPVTTPFGAATLVEHSPLRAIPVGDPTPAQDGLAFLDGIQRYAVEARFGLVPIVRGYVAAAVLARTDGALRTASHLTEEFLAAPMGRLDAQQRAALDSVGLPVHDVDATERSHPILDVQFAARVVEERRERLERVTALEYVDAFPERYLVVDGALGNLADVFGRAPGLIGLVKSHETQFLDGADLEVALTLPQGHRTSAFERAVGKRGHVHTWYLRLWPWEGHDLLYGLVRLERPPGADVSVDATAASRWILAERAPLSAPDGRWDRLIYPIQQVETYLRAHAGGWW